MWYLSSKLRYDNYVGHKIDLRQADMTISKCDKMIVALLAQRIALLRY